MKSADRLSIAIIVPVFNEMQRLPELFHLLASLNADEIIIVDGSSTDGSDSFISEQLDKILFEKSSTSIFRWCQSRSGRAIQMNTGAELCQSDILLFLHADTSITCASLNYVREVMGRSDLIGGRFDVSLSGSNPMFRIIEHMINLRSRLSRISTGDQAIFVRNDVFVKLGGFPDQPLMEDIEFSKRLKKRGRIICLRDKVTTSSRRWEKYGVLKTIFLMWKLRFLYWLGIPVQRLSHMYDPSYHAGE